MEPVFVDLHIHTSSDPNSLDESYDLELLKNNIEKISEKCPYLVSLTDHNTINKVVYLKASRLFDHLILGAELHVRNYISQKPYHCHIYFDLKVINEAYIDKINDSLDKLYPNKVVLDSTDNIPRLEDFMKTFDSFDFILLPHGGQSHSTFHSSIPNGVQFDNALERSIYYNHFDGFTARSNLGLERTIEYFKRLGISDFVNLVTSTDNYCPQNYPNAKAGDAAEFVPTWMLANPTFNGLRLSLSESSRFVYGEKPDSWTQYIQNVSLKNDAINIDVDLTPGLNVVIGGSSSGKTLFVDSLFRKISNDFSESDYLKTSYNVKDIQVQNPAGLTPHYISQNYIIKVCDQKDKENTIDDITILKSVFPADSDERNEIANGLSELSSNLSSLVHSIKEIENIQGNLLRIPKLSHLIVTEIIHGNPLNFICPTSQIIELLKYNKASYEKDIKQLDIINEFLIRNPLVNHDVSLVKKLKEELNTAYTYSNFESSIREIINKHKKEIDDALELENREIQTKRIDFEKLLKYIKDYFHLHTRFYNSLESISKFSIKISTKKIESMGHKLFIDNRFELTKEKFLEVVNIFLKPEFAIETFNDIKPDALFEDKFRKRDPKVADYDDFENKINSKFMGMNRKKYKIITKEGKNFENLSAGWKTSVILDLILGWESDIAPLIIDQPEDNLATGYINKGLIEAIKKCKIKKQIILVSHNATIPMLGDAQNIVMCKNDDKIISIKSNPLEGEIDGISAVDLIAEITDGGKISIKKRVKKYNLKNFRGTNEAAIQKG